jgi:hypothetical protein
MVPYLFGSWRILAASERVGVDYAKLPVNFDHWSESFRWDMMGLNMV